VVWSRLNPFRLPIHAPVVHFPIALLSIAWGMLVFRYATGDARWDARARSFYALGIATLPLAMITAVVDTRGFQFVTHPRWDAALIWHAIAGLVVMALTVAHFLWRRRYGSDQLVGGLAVADLALASVAFWALVTVGLLAGEMVFAK